MSGSNRNESLRFPLSKDIYGVDDRGKLLHLLQIVSGEIYDNTIANKSAFEKKIIANKKVKKNFPHLKVQFYYQELFVGKGFSLNNPPFAAITTQDEDGNTLILAWRGSKTPADWLKNFSLHPKDLHSCGTIKVQGAYYDVIQKYFKTATESNQTGKGRDLKRLVETGSVGLNIKDGKPIQRIILTGHSLGGGLAQVAHQILECESSDFSKAIQKSKVDVYTVAFSAPMTTIANDMNYKVEKMHNFVLSQDVIPRLYGNLDYLDKVLQSVLLKLDKNSPAKSVVENFIQEYIVRKVDLLKSYRHVGKIVYYADFQTMPKVITPRQFSDIMYNRNDNLESAVKVHMDLIRGPALA